MKELVNTLIAKKVNPTAMRLVILDFLLKQSRALSLTDIELALDRTDRVTLYRTIKTFEEHGIIHRIDNGSGITQFALCQNCDALHHHDAHVHFYCNSCQETVCLPKTSIPEISLPANFQSEEMNLVVKGICSECMR